MSESPVAILREYTDSIEAETVRIRLAAAGIQAFVTGTDAATALGLGGAATLRQVQVKVPKADIERAAAILEEDKRRIHEMGPWICSRCREQNEAAFEVCWSCDKPRTNDDERGRINEIPPSVAGVGFGSLTNVNRRQKVRDDGNPYRPVLMEDDSPGQLDRDAEPLASDAIAESATRCFRAAIVGAIVFPPLVCLYGVYLLMKMDRAAYQIRSVRRRLLIAWCINLVNIPVWLVFWSAMI